MLLALALVFGAATAAVPPGSDDPTRGATSPDSICSASTLLDLGIREWCPERMALGEIPPDRVLGTRVQQVPDADAEVNAAAPEVGVQFHALWSDYTDQERVAVLDKLAAAGVTWVRIDLGWQSLQETGRDSYSQWYVDLADRTIDLARARGISVLATLWATPSWANGGAGRHVPPTDPADYARVARWAATHFNGRVGAWEVWNEPNHPSFWSGSAADYTALLKAAYPAFKLGAPATPVVLGGPSYNDTDWLQEMYEAGGQGSFDIMATHPYQGPADLAPEAADDGTIWRLNHVTAVHELMQEYGDGDKQIWFTELGWSSHPNTGSEKEWQRGVTEEQQADFLVRTIKHVSANFPYVTNMFWYNERNRASGKVHLDNYGLLNRDLSEKPAYVALRDFLDAPDPTAPDVAEPSEPLIMLENGDFEAGLNGWTAFNGAATKTSDARSGSYAAKLVRKRDAYGLTAAAVSVPPGSSVKTDGFLKAKRPGQTVRVILIESVDGTVVGRKAVRTTVGKRWQSFPTVVYVPTGSAGATLTIKVKTRGQRGDVLFVDDVSLIASS